MRNRLDAASFQRAGHDQRVHAHARHRAAINIDGVDAPGRHDVIDLLDKPAQAKCLWADRSPLADCEFLVL